MPFNTSSWGYTIPVGATNAVSGELITSVLWNGVFADLSGALNQLGALRIIPQVFVTAGATTYVASTNLVFAVVEVPGGGGGGGGGGGYAQSIIPAATIGVSVTVTVGAAGIGGSGITLGVTGGTSSFGGLVVAAGGNPGLGATAAAAASGGLGGIGVTGQVLKTGSPGGMGMAAAITTVLGPSGNGGSRPWPAYAAQGVVAVTSAVTGAVGMPAAGGAGGQCQATVTATAVGGAGGPGQIFVWEYVF